MPKRILGCILVIVGLLLCTAGVRLSMQPEMYRAAARIKFESGKQNQESTFNQSNFILKELEIIQSEAVLGKVIRKLELNREWGRRYKKGAQLSNSDSLAILKARLDFRPVPNTMLIDVRFTSEDANEAAKIANAIVEDSKRWRLDRNFTLIAGEFDRLKASLREQEWKINAASNRVEKLKKQLFDSGDRSSQSENSVHPEVIRGLDANYQQAKHELDDAIKIRQSLVRRLNTPEGDAGPEIEIIDRAIPPIRAVSPNGPIRAALVLASVLTGVVTIGLGVLCFRRPLLIKS